MDIEESSKSVRQNESRRSRRVVLTPGTMVVDRFCIGRLLGVGTFGAVYECTDNNDLNKPFAIKVDTF